jgi:hypothetical protein
MVEAPERPGNFAKQIGVSSVKIPGYVEIRADLSDVA